MKWNPSIELARLVALLAVISLHANAFGLFGPDIHVAFAVDEMARFAVPLFFLISGYLWRDGDIAAPVRPLLKLFFRLALPFVFWAAFYSICDRFSLFYPRVFFGGIGSYLIAPVTGGIGFHLWFLPALGTGTALVWAGLHYLGMTRTLIVMFVLFLIGVILGAYIDLFGITLPVAAYRNGLFFAPVFLLLGHLMRQRTLPGIGAFATLTLVGIVMQFAEGLYVAGSFPHGHDLSFGTLAFAVGVFGLVLRSGIDIPALTPLARDVFGAYLVHLFIVKVIAAHVPARGTAVALASIFGTLILSLLISRLLKTNRFTRRLVS